MYMNLDQYNSCKSRVIRDLYNKKIPETEEYLTNNFSPDDFTDLIKEMESDGLINNVKYVHQASNAENVMPDFEKVIITDKGMAVLE